MVNKYRYQCLRCSVCISAIQCSRLQLGFSIGSNNTCRWNGAHAPATLIAPVLLLGLIGFYKPVFIKVLHRSMRQFSAPITKSPA
ncbi:hypothetical protein BJY00DRAFT_294765 [Aspergillus carlsbadensis]|nr:hypothetical protein BJY00DRAFT_294765 [Aspergillus carlsbadensis]